MYLSGSSPKQPTHFANLPYTVVLTHSPLSVLPYSSLPAPLFMPPSSTLLLHLKYFYSFTLFRASHWVWSRGCLPGISWFRFLSLWWVASLVWFLSLVVLTVPRLASFLWGCFVAWRKWLVIACWNNLGFSTPITSDPKFGLCFHAHSVLYMFCSPIFWFANPLGCVWSKVTFIYGVFICVTLLCRPLFSLESSTPRRFSVFSSISLTTLMRVVGLLYTNGGNS